MSTFIDPTSDIFVKYLLGSEKNKDLLLSFINAVIMDSNFKQIVSVEIKNPFNIKNFSIDKESILDVKATDESGRQYDIEVQSTGNENFKARSLYYWARLYSSQLKESDLYTLLKPTICINLLNFEIFGKFDFFHSCFLLMETNNPDFVLTDHLILHYLELPKLKNKINDNKLIRWLLFLKNEGKQEDIMEILIQEDKDIARAHKEYENFTHDENLRDLYEARLKWQLDHNTDLEIARQKGIEQGIEKGIEKGKILENQEILIGFLKSRFDADITDYDIKLIKKVNDINKLKNALGAILAAGSKDGVIDKLK